MGGGKRIEVDENRHGLDPVRKQLVFEQSINKEKSIVRGQSQFQINPLVKDRKGNSKNLFGVLAEKPNRQNMESYLGEMPPAIGELPEESKTYEQQQVERLRQLPMDANEMPSTTSQDVGWLLGLAMRLKEGRRPKSAPGTSNAEGGSTARSAWTTSSLTGSRRDPATTPRPPWSMPGTARSSACGAPESSVDGGGAGSTASSRRSSKVPYDFSRPNVSGGLARYWRPKSRSDVVTFADIFSEKTGTHPYLKPRVPEK